MSEHEKMLRKGIEILKKKGFRIIRLDRRIVPDAIAIKDNKIVAIESSTNPTNVWLTERKLKDSQYDSTIIITKPYSKHYHSPEEYFEVFKLRKEGCSYSEIAKIIEEKFHRRIPRSLICDWIKGKKKPLTLLNEYS